MPLTFAHPVAVLPFARTRLPFAALAIGSMVPDLPLFVPPMTNVGLGYSRTHTPLGVVTIDVVLGALVWALWRYVLAAPLADAAPAALRRRLPRPADGGWLVLPAALVGAATHVVWDEFTHVDRWGMRHIPWLAAQHGPWLGAQWLQYLSGVLGVLLLVIVAGVLLARRHPAAPAPRLRPRLAPWVLLAPLITAPAVAATRVTAGGRLHDVLYDSVTRGGAAAGLVLLVMTGHWHARPGPSRARRPR